MSNVTRKWTMKDGTKIRICDMGDSHLYNAIRLVERLAQFAHQQFILNVMCAVASVNGEMAQYYVEREADEAMKESWEQFLPPVYKFLKAELERRKENLPETL